MRRRIWLPENYRKVSLKVRGYFEIDLIDSKTGNIKQHFNFSNIITDSGLDQIGLGNILSSCYQFLEVGIGSSTPTASDTALDNPLPTRSNNNGGDGDITTTNNAPEYIKRRITRIFEENEVNGQISELGFWTSRVGGILINRALVLDSEGLPTTINKTPSDILKVVFEFRLYPPNDVVGQNIFYDIPINYIIRPQGSLLSTNWGRALDTLGNWTPTAYAYQSNILAPRASINDPSPKFIASSINISPYIIGNFYRDVTFTWDSTISFSNGIGLIGFSPWGNSSSSQMLYQMQLDEQVYKSNSQFLIINFRISWGRY